MDVHSKEQRSKNMAAIKSTATKDEIRLAKALWNKGHRYRKNNKTVFGKPDLTFKKHKLAIFIDSEFFHGKDFETKKKPATNAEFWEKKIRRNMERDQEVNAHLINEGWTVLRFWSTDIRKRLDEIVAIIEAHLTPKYTVSYIVSEDGILPIAAEPTQDEPVNTQSINRQ